MKKISILLLLIGGLWACSNDLELITEWKDIPIVYGMLSVQDDVHYIRVEKAFLDGQISALDLAKNPDSIYYANALVQLERPSFNSTISLERVDASQEGLPRAAGVFATNPNYLYKFVLADDEKLQGGETIRLSVSTGESDKVATSETQIVGEITLIEGQPGTQINWEYDRSIRLSWRPDPNAYIYDVIMRINIEESVEGSNSEFVARQLQWKIAENLVRTSFSDNTREQIQVKGEDFYRFMEGALEPTETIIRHFESMDFVVIAGGQELVEFTRIQQANTGITSSQVVPSYSNIEGGIGLFTSRNSTMREGITIGSMAFDSLEMGIYTRQLNFREN